ncbi:Zinc finger protein ZAT2 [Cardamine amara subsp. amara]|uniref:Zinc finger protein ZAT2 n=1 Tax=Cardamine amara subsp. amara TaxID=228776 RepID=A0ABD1ARF6_CARAN
MKRRDFYDDDSSSSEYGEFGLKEGSEDEDDSPQPPPQLKKKHFCVICNKQFSSGKAYGGHVRIHSIEYSNKGKIKKMKMKKKRKSDVVKKEKEKETDLIRADVEGKIKCCLCGKEFQTLPSLFGHMRRHPDRSWKGIRPPPSPEKFKLRYLDADDADDDDDDDGMSRTMVMSDVTEDVQQAACNLMMLNYDSRNYWAGINKDIESPKSEVRSSSCYKDGSEKEIEVKVNKPKDEAKRSLWFDLNQPCHEDHPYSHWN